MTNNPTVSYVIPSYNSASTVLKAVKSVQKQWYSKLEILVIDDASTDETEKIIRELAEGDSRIKYFKNNENLGLPKTLNKGFELASGELIGRMDSDDICLPWRTSLQVAKFLKNPKLLLVGGSAIYFGGRRLRFRKAKGNNSEIRKERLFRTPFVHPAVMFNSKNFIKSGLSYNENFWCAQDYEMWSRISAEFEMANVKAPVLLYRDNVKGNSSKSKLKQIERSELHRQIYLNCFQNESLSSEFIDEHLEFSCDVRIGVCDYKRMNEYLDFITKTRNGQFKKVAFTQFKRWSYWKIAIERSDTSEILKLGVKTFGVKTYIGIFSSSLKKIIRGFLF